jgi:molybdate transport system substrate-binding protein
VRFKATKEGDLFLSGSAFFVEQLAKDGFVTHSFSIVLHPPVLAVHPSKTGEITTVDDLAKPGVRVGLGDPKAMALGRTAEEILSHSDKKDAILANTVVRAATVKQLSLYVTKGDVDAAILARSDAVQAKDALVFFDIDPAWYTPEIVTIAALNTSRHPEEALELAEFLRSPEAVAVFLSTGSRRCRDVRLLHSMNLLDRVLILPLLFFSLIVGGVFAALIGQVSPEELARSLVHPETLFALRFSLTTSCAHVRSTLHRHRGGIFPFQAHFPRKGIPRDAPRHSSRHAASHRRSGTPLPSRQGPSGGASRTVGHPFHSHPWGAVVAQSFVATPIVLRSAQAAFASVPKGYEEAALMLGLSPLQVFFRINIPLAANRSSRE